jgi:hypothetical protein
VAFHLAREGSVSATMILADWTRSPASWLLQIGVMACCRPTGVHGVFSGTGFSREEACANTVIFAARHPTPSRLKPVPWVNTVPVGWAQLPARLGGMQTPVPPMPQ